MPRDRRLLTILLVVLVQMLGASMILPILPLYAKNEFGLSPQMVTLLAASFFAAQFIAGPILGRLSDKVGRVPILLVSQIGTAISFLMLAFAPNAAWLFAARIFDGITGGNIVVAQAYLTDIAPPEKRAQYLGLVFAMFGISFAIGPAIGGFVSGIGLQIPYMVAAVAATIAVIITWRVLDESLPREEREARKLDRLPLTAKLVLGSRPLLLTLALGFLAQFVLGLIVSTYALIGEAYWFAGEDATAVNIRIGLLLTGVGVAQVITQTRILGPVISRVGEVKTAIVGTLTRGLGLAVAVVLPSGLLATAGGALMAVGGGLSLPPAQAIATRALPDQFRGGVLGLFNSVASLGTILSTALGGVLFAMSVTLPAWVGAALSLVAVIPALLLLRTRGVAVGPDAAPEGPA